MAKHRKQKKRKSEKLKMPLIRAKFSAANGGFGFAAPLNQKEQDIFIPPQRTGNAIEGDIVSVRLIADDRLDSRGSVGEIVEILERTKQTFVAEVNGRRSARPLDKRLPEEVNVTALPKGAKPGDWVRLSLLTDAKSRRRPENLTAEGVELIGKAGTVKADLDAVVAEFHIEAPYTPAQERAAKRLVPDDSLPRKNMERAFTITIDPADAHDFDDAISVSKGKKPGEVILGVHIADVAAYIKSGSTFDKEARKRAFSAYLPGMFRPMLPKPLTAKMSLQEGVSSPAHSVMFTIEKDTGKILFCTRCHTTVKIKKRLDYKTVQEFIGNPASAPADWTAVLKRNLHLLIKTVRRMREYRRNTERFLDMPLPEIRVLCNEETYTVTGLERKIQSEADALVEECMLAANSAVAEELIRREIPGLFRIHPEPEEDKIEQFSEICRDTFQFSPGDILSSRKACQHFLETIPDDTRKPVILSLFLRSLPRASYDAEPGLHYGLGKEKYSHFTSPIRRYPDLLVHQQLWAADQKKSLRPKKVLAELALECSAKEENNDNAAFAASDRLKLHYLRELGALDNGSIYEAVISRVTSTGLVCSIDELGLFGFIPKEKLRGGNYYRSRHRQQMNAERGHSSYKAGNFIYVALDSIDPVRGTAVFRPAI